METVPNPAVRAAVQALDAFGAVTQREARTLLSMWARRDQLTAADVEQVLAHYGELISSPIGDTDPTGLTYSRDVEPTGGPLPPGVYGYAIGGRETNR